MVLYVPGTEETDLKKVIMSLQQVAAYLTAGKIAFPAAQNASSDPNTLDDYEEGSWTPVPKFGGGNTGLTMATQGGQYTKIGNIVRVGCAIVFSAKGSSTGAFTIEGLPFAHSAFLTAFSPYLTSMTAGVGDTMLNSLIGGGATSFGIYKMASGSSSQLTDADFTNTSAIYVNGLYQV